MDTLLFGVVTISFLVLTGVSVFVAYCLGILTIAVLDYRWNGKKKE